jgi:hypothetical protein
MTPPMHRSDSIESERPVREDPSDDIRTADVLAAPTSRTSRVLVCCLAIVWTVLRACGAVLVRSLRAWDLASAAVGRAAGRAGCAVLTALGPLGRLLRRALVPLGRALFRLWQIAVRPLGPLATRLLTRGAAAASRIGRQIIDMVTWMRPFLDAIAARARLIARAVATAVRPIADRAARAAAAIRQMCKLLRHAIHATRRPNPRTAHATHSHGEPQWDGS